MSFTPIKPKNALIISDGKPGHVNQSRALCALLDKRSVELIVTRISEAREAMLRTRMGLGHAIPHETGKAIKELKTAFTPQSVAALEKALAEQPGLIVSAGTSVAAANLISAKASGAKSVVMMRPSGLPPKLFDLMVLPEHDRLRGHHPNVVYTPVALSYFDEDRRLEADSEICARFGAGATSGKPLALIIGGDSPYYRMEASAILDLAKSCRDYAKGTGINLIATTSRRTPEEVEGALRSEFGGAGDRGIYFFWGRTDSFNPLPALLPAACGAIVTEDSVSMISEAILQGKRPLVVPLTEKKYSKKFGRFRHVLEDRDLAQWMSAPEMAKLLKSPPATLWRPALVDLSDIKSQAAAILESNV